MFAYCVWLAFSSSFDFSVRSPQTNKKKCEKKQNVSFSITFLIHSMFKDEIHVLMSGCIYMLRLNNIHAYGILLLVVAVVFFAALLLSFSLFVADIRLRLLCTLLLFIIKNKRDIDEINNVPSAYLHILRMHTAKANTKNKRCVVDIM